MSQPGRTPRPDPPRRRTTPDASSTPTLDTADTPVARRGKALRDAAQAKHAAALLRAEDGLRRLIKSGDEITFRSVARTGSVGLDFLYAQPDLRRRIEGLRAQQQASRPSSRATPERNQESSEANVLRTLAAQLKAERSTRLELVRDLEVKLAAAHGEILGLRRRLGVEHQHD